MTDQLVVFGRKLCGACAELREQLRLAGIEHEYHSLDMPTSDFNAGDANSIAEWHRARTALAMSHFYGLGDNAPYL
ncbi:MAG: hypothetical protein JRI80_00305 [Deltaproteobacteria bacterium]|nr:hypothetical protein [Deltaproteobacteria bacterium]